MRTVHFNLNEKIEILKTKFEDCEEFNLQMAKLLDVMTFDQIKSLARAIKLIAKGKDQC